MNIKSGVSSYAILPHFGDDYGYVKMCSGQRNAHGRADDGSLELLRSHGDIAALERAQSTSASARRGDTTVASYQRGGIRRSLSTLNWGKSLGHK